MAIERKFSFHVKLTKQCYRIYRKIILNESLNSIKNSQNSLFCTVLAHSCVSLFCISFLHYSIFTCLRLQLFVAVCLCIGYTKINNENFRRKSFSFIYSRNSNVFELKVCCSVLESFRMTILRFSHALSSTCQMWAGAPFEAHIFTFISTFLSLKLSWGACKISFVLQFHSSFVRFDRHAVALICSYHCQKQNFLIPKNKFSL